MLQVHPAARPFIYLISTPPHRPGGGHPAVDVFARTVHSAVETDADRHLWAENGSLKTIVTVNGSTTSAT